DACRSRPPRLAVLRNGYLTTEQELPAPRTRRRQLRHTAPAGPGPCTLMNRGTGLAGSADSRPSTGSLFASYRWLSFRFLLTPSGARCCSPFSAGKTVESRLARGV